MQNTPTHSRRRRSRRDQTTSRRNVLVVSTLGVVAAVVLGVLVLMGSFDDSVETHWSEGEQHGDWAVRYTGYGQVTCNGQRVTLEPKSAENMDITYGGLVHTAGTCRDADFAMTVNTEAQVRNGKPNVWEVGWVLWNFQSDTRFYAVALKPNGWEISKQDPDYPGNQRFLTSGDSPQFPIGQDYRVTVTQNDNGMTVTADGEELATVVDTDNPYREGSVGLYTKDARVHFSDFDLPDCTRSP